MFKKMSMAELDGFIANCHRRRDYDAYFEQACRERNRRIAMFADIDS